MSKLSKLVLVSGAFIGSALPVLAVGEPVDLSTAGTTIAGYVPVAAGWGIAVFVAMVGVRVIMSAFKAVTH